MHATPSRLVASLATVIALAACSSTERHGDTDTATVRADTAISAGASVAGPVKAPTPPPLSEANILALMDEANVADSAAGSIAARKGTNSAVRQFGQRMVRDHHELRVQGQQVASRLGVTPAPPPGDTLPASAQRFAARLDTMPKGAAWDSVYITHAVLDHRAVEQMLAGAQGFATDSTLALLIAHATSVVHSHLTTAGAIADEVAGGGNPTRRAP